MKDIFKSDSLFLILIPLLLSAIGVIFILSTGQLEDGTNTNLYLRQLVWIILGVSLAVLIISIDYYYIVETSIIYYLFGLFVLILTLVIGKEIKGAKSWLGIGGLGIQFSEIMKICYILFYAKYLSSISKDDKGFHIFLKAILILIPPLILIMLQPDLGTTIVFCSIFTIMSLVSLKDVSLLLSGIIIVGLTSIFVISYAYYQFYFLINNPNNSSAILDIILVPSTFFALAVILLIYALITFIIELIQPIPWINKFTRGSLILGASLFFTGLAGKILKPYQWNRLLVFINPEFDRLGSGYNSIQSQIAIGSGGLLGRGIFKGSQNLRGFLPEKHTDFIFAILAEETGFVGCIFVLFLYGLYFYLIIRVIFTAKDLEGSYIATGILALYATHTIINIGMNLGVAPVTGLPLPFISYGGSFYISSILGAALLINIYKRRFIH